jgi:3-hydroxybutyryl-CoA dehydrogenase
MELLRDAGKVPVHVRRDVPGFVGNRLQHAMKREAIALVAAGVCDAETIDIVVREGFGARTAVLGPMEQSDLVGTNLTLDIAEVLYEHLDRTPGPHPLLREIVKAGKLGMKTGQGLRKWTPEQADAVRTRLSRFLAEQAKARKKIRS